MNYLCMCMYMCVCIYVCRKNKRPIYMKTWRGKIMWLKNWCERTGCQFFCKNTSCVRKKIDIWYVFILIQYVYMYMSPT